MASKYLLRIPIAVKKKEKKKRKIMSEKETGKVAGNIYILLNSEAVFL